MDPAFKFIAYTAAVFLALALGRLFGPSLVRRVCVSRTPRLHKLLADIPDHWDRQDFVLCGSAALAFRGVRDVGDLDILARPNIYEEGKGQCYSMSRHFTENIQLFDVPQRGGLTFEQVMAEADFIDGFYVQSPRHTLAIKALVPPRAKDRKDMVLLAKVIEKEKDRSKFAQHQTGPYR